MHLKGGLMVQIVRWSFVAVCFVIFVFSITILTISAVNYTEMRITFDELGSQHNYDFNPHLVFYPNNPQAALAIFYAGIVLGTIFTLISCVGWCGAACLDRCFLISYAILLSFVLFGSCITLALVTHLYQDDLKIMAAKMYREFVEHLYGRADVLLQYVADAIDEIQKRHRCCGPLSLQGDEKAIVQKYGTTAMHYTLLYWLESTQWGQIQANSIGYNESRVLAWTPESCCVNVQPGCSAGIFRDRYHWDSAKEKHWKMKIHAAGCAQHLLDFSHLDPSDRANIVIISIVTIIIMLATIVLACWMWQSLAIYEYSSKDSELEQRRHLRRRWRRKHRGHPPRAPPKDAISPPPDLMFEEDEEPRMKKVSAAAPPPPPILLSGKGKVKAGGPSIPATGPKGAPGPVLMVESKGPSTATFIPSGKGGSGSASASKTPSD